MALLGQKKECQVCKNPFYAKWGVSYRQWSKSKWCSRNCFNSTFRGKKHTKEHNKKISLGLLGRKVTKETRLKLSKSNIGKIRSFDTREKLRIAHLGQTAWNKGKHPKYMQKENHWAWKEDRNEVLEKHRMRSSFDWKNWRTSVFARDNFTCKDCGATGVYIEPHHIIPVRSDKNKLFDTNNGITLCRPCHKKTMWKESEYAERYFALVKAQI